MQFPSRVSAFVLGVILTAGCGSEPAAPAEECSLPDDPHFDFTKVTLDADKSNKDCPEIDAALLDADALAEQGSCEQSIVDCVIELNCDYEGFAIHGRMIESGDGLTGRFDIETPVTCLYTVKAKWKASDAGD